MNYFILDKNKKVIACDNISQWRQWISNLNNRIVKQEIINGYFISTAFLGISHGFFSTDPTSDTFETMIFNSGIAKDYQTRCDTYEEALDMHQKAVDHILHERKRNRNDYSSLA